MNWFEKHWEAIAIGVGAAAVGFFIYEKWSSPYAGPPLPATPTTITLAPGQITLAHTVALGSQITLNIPSDGNWDHLMRSTRGQTQVTELNGDAPASFVTAALPNAPESVTATWVDSTGHAQTTQLTLTIG